MSNIIAELEKDSLKTNVPDFRAGDTVSVNVQVKEGEKVRTQVYTGVVIQRKGAGIQQTFTVRKISGQIPVERIFPVHSPNITGIKVDRPGKVKRARIFYLRELQGKKARIKKRDTEKQKG